MSDTELITRTDALRRLRVAAAICREVCGIPRNAVVEVGVRTAHVHFDSEPPVDANWYGEHDDLDFHVFMPEASHEEFVRRPGYVAHLYFSFRNPSHGDFELMDTCCVWLGTRTEAPCMLDANGGHLALANRR
jgi:hypothetical protein